MKLLRKGVWCSYVSKCLWIGYKKQAKHSCQSVVVLPYTPELGQALYWVVQGDRNILSTEPGKERKWWMRWPSFHQNCVWSQVTIPQIGLITACLLVVPCASMQGNPPPSFRSQPEAWEIGYSEEICNQSLPLPARASSDVLPFSPLPLLKTHALFMSYPEMRNFRESYPRMMRFCGQVTPPSTPLPVERCRVARDAEGIYDGDHARQASVIHLQGTYRTSPSTHMVPWRF